MKKVILSYAAFIITILLLSSCNGVNKASNPFQINLFPVQIGDLYGYIDTNGKIVINPQFKEATLFNHGIALVALPGDESKWGYITEEGKYIINPQYDGATIFNDGIAWVTNKDGSPFAINKENKVLGTIPNASCIRTFHEGLAAFSIYVGNNLKWGFCDKNIKVVISPQYKEVGVFSGGKCAVENEDGKWGYIDKKGKLIINYQFDDLYDDGSVAERLLSVGYRKRLIYNRFINNKAVVMINNLFGVIDTNGKFIINPQFDDILIDEDGRYHVIKNGKTGWCDNKGNYLITPQFDIAFPFFNNKLTCVVINKKWGYIDKNGKFLINPQFDIATNFINGIAFVSIGNKISIINEKGTFITGMQFDDISDDLLFLLTTNSNEYSTHAFVFGDIINETESSESSDELNNVPSIPETFSTDSIIVTNSDTNGISHTLSDREISPKQFVAEFNESGKVVVRVKVDREGNIVHRMIISSTSERLSEIVLQKLNQAHFTKKPDALLEDIGDITFNFKTKGE